MNYPKFQVSSFKLQGLVALVLLGLVARLGAQVIGGGAPVFGGPAGSGTGGTEVVQILGTNLSAPVRLSYWSKPVIAFDTWAAFQGLLNVSTYSNIVERWITNLSGTLKSNGLATAVSPAIWIDDGWQAAARDGSGNLFWDTNVFPASLSNVIAKVHANGCLLFLYTAHATNTCGGMPGSPTNTMYRDIQKMMDWGADGVFIDTCQGVTVVNDDVFLRENLRLANQAVTDYQAILYQTQGVVRPFYISTTTGSGIDTRGTANIQNVTPFHLATVNSLAWNWRREGTGPMSNVLANARDALEFVGPFIRPNFYPDMSRIYDTGNGSHKTWQNDFSAHAMVSAQMRTGVGDTRVGAWTNVAWAGSYGEGYEWYQMTNYFKTYLCNKDLMAVWRESVWAPRVVYSNALKEVWVKEVAGGRKAVWLVNLTVTNYTFALTKNDLGVTDDSWLIRNVYTNTDAATFSGTFSPTVEATNSLLYLLEPLSTQPVEIPRSWQEVTVSGTGVSLQTTAAAAGGPWSHQDGVYQANAGNLMQFTLSVPTWATRVTMRFYVFSADSGAVAWTNTQRSYWWSATGRVTSAAYDSSTHVSLSSGQATWITNYANFPLTNSPKEIIASWNASTNASARSIVDGIYLKFE